MMRKSQHVGTWKRSFVGRGNKWMIAKTQRSGEAGRLKLETGGRHEEVAEDGKVSSRESI